MRPKIFGVEFHLVNLYANLQNESKEKSNFPVGMASGIIH